MKNIYKIIIGAATLTPSLAFGAGKDLDFVINLAVKYINIAIELIIAFAVLTFVYNVYRYFIAGGDNAESKTEAGKYVLFSVVGFFVILSIWGLVNILLNTFQLNDSAPSRGFFPTFRSSSGGTNRLPNNGVPNAIGTNNGSPNAIGTNNESTNTGGFNVNPGSF